MGVWPGPRQLSGITGCPYNRIKRGSVKQGWTVFGSIDR